MCITTLQSVHGNRSGRQIDCEDFVSGGSHLLPWGLPFPEELSASFQAMPGIGDGGISDLFAKGRITLNFGFRLLLIS